MRRIIQVVAAVCLLVAPLARAETNGFFFRDGDRPIVFLGDSITEQQLYTRLMESYLYTRFPKWKLSFRNLGWGGDNAAMVQHGFLDKAMAKDILPLKPVAATIDFGMNDARAGAAAVRTYVINTSNLVNRLLASGIRVALLTPSPEERFETNAPAGSSYNTILAKYSEALPAIAEKAGVPFVDQFTPFVKVIEDGRAAGVLTMDGKIRLIPDGVHPHVSGHLVMAASILKGLHAPALVSRVSIDAGQRKVTGAQACRVEMLEGTELAFRRLDEALPWPIPVEAQFVLKVPGFRALEDLDRYELQVTKLTADKYDVFIDDVKVGTYDKGALAAGVNFALQAGPITEQGMKIWKMIGEKNIIFGLRWKVQMAVLPPWASGPEVEKMRDAEFQRLDSLMEAKEKEIDDTRQPVAHVWKLVPAS